VTAERDQAVSFFGLLRRLVSKDRSPRPAAAIDFLQAFGRHLQALTHTYVPRRESHTPQTLNGEKRVENRSLATGVAGVQEPVTFR